MSSKPASVPGSHSGHLAGDLASKSRANSATNSTGDSAANSTDQQAYFFESPTPYVEERIGSVAIYCSDGRLGDQTDEFLHQGLKQPRYDRLTCPGGPACMSGRSTAYWESVAMQAQLRFLIQVHAIQNVVLIAHSGCAYYRERLALPIELIEEEQLKDMQRAAEVIGRMNPELQVLTFYARRRSMKIRFEHVSLIGDDAAYGQGD